MTTVRNAPIGPRVQEALSELRGMIERKYPSASFEVSQGDDPEGIYLTPTIDIDDTEEVFELLDERLLQMQIDEELPVYVFPVRPVERVIAELQAER
jgi:hypothetical protein